MAKWNIEKRYGDDVSITSCNFGRFRLTVHRHIDYENDQWLASAAGLFNCFKLKSKSLEEAKTQAKAKLQVILQEAIDEIASENP